MSCAGAPDQGQARAPALGLSLLLSAARVTPSLAGPPSDAHLLREHHVRSRLCLRREASEPTLLCSLHSETQAQPRASPGPHANPWHHRLPWHMGRPGCWPLAAPDSVHPSPELRGLTFGENLRSTRLEFSHLILPRPRTPGFRPELGCFIVWKVLPFLPGFPCSPELCSHPPPFSGLPPCFAPVPPTPPTPQDSTWCRTHTRHSLSPCSKVTALTKHVCTPASTSQEA